MTTGKRWTTAASVCAALLVGCGTDAGTVSGSASAEDTSDGSASDPTQGSNSQGDDDGDTDATMSATGPADESSGGSEAGSDDGSGGADESVGTDTGSASAESSSSGDEGDSAEDTTTAPVEPCEAPGELITCDADTTDPFQAMGLGCVGEANEVIAIFNPSFTSPDASAWQIARQFGTYIDPNTNAPIWSPSEGEQFLIVSSGPVPAPDDQGIVTMPSGQAQANPGDANQDNKPLPAPMSPFTGSDGGNGGTPFVDCDFVNDCSDTLEEQWNLGGGGANDLLWFQFELAVPGGTHGFSFDFAYFSAEFPEWVNTTFNYIFVVWSNSETYTGNLCFVDDQPCTVTALWPAQFQELAPELAGTGFDNVGGGTGWYEAKASAEPGEQLQLTWAVFDMGDQILDTLVILDNWRWDCEGCVPSEVMGCGIDPM